MLAGARHGVAAGLARFDDFVEDSSAASCTKYSSSDGTNKVKRREYPGRGSEGDWHGTQTVAPFRCGHHRRWPAGGCWDGSRADGYRYNPALFVPTPILRRRACGADYRVPCQRGVAILSPVESPDHCDYVVGGKPLCVPYYVDYCPHWKRGPRVLVPGNGVGYGRQMMFDVPEAASAIEGTDEAIPAAGSYGLYDGAPKDEARLFRLGGFSDEGSLPSAEQQTGDLVDMIEGGR